MLNRILYSVFIQKTLLYMIGPIIIAYVYDIIAYILYIIPGVLNLFQPGTPQKKFKQPRTPNIWSDRG